QFDAIVRAHEKERLAMPIAALEASGAPYHNFLFMHLRRLAWFVPSLLSMWLDAPPALTTIGPILRAAAGLEVDAWRWEPREEAALGSFFDVVLRAVLATPVEAAAGRALETVRLAAAMHVSVTPLLETWMSERATLAEDHLLAALDASQARDARRFL